MSIGFVTYASKPDFLASERKSFSWWAVIAMMAHRFGEKPKGTAKHKGAKGRRSKNKNKIKTKAKTANRNVNRRQQKVAMAKTARSNYRNRGRREASPAATADTEKI